MSHLNLKFEEIFKLTVFAMHVNRSHPSITRDKTFKTIFACSIGSIFCSFCLLTYSITVHDLKVKNYAEASKNLIMAIVAITYIFKYTILLVHQDSITELIRVMSEDYKLAENFSDEEKNIVIKYAKRGAKVSKLWLLSAGAGCGIIPVKALVLMCYYYWEGNFKLVPLFDFTYPPIIESYKLYPPIYLCLFLLILYFDAAFLTMYIGFDPLVPIFMLHACGQIELLNKKIFILFDSELESEVTKEQLLAINIKLQKIYSFVQIIKKNFTVVYEFVMKSTTFLLPLTAFQITECLRKNEISVEFITFLTGAILHFYIPCYYSDLLLEKSNELRQAIYSSGWEKCPDMKIRKTVLFMLMRTIKPLVISTVFLPICLDTFAAMCRQSYTILNLINASLA